MHKSTQKSDLLSMVHMMGKIILEIVCITCDYMRPILHELHIGPVYNGDFYGGQEVRQAALLIRLFRKLCSQRNWGGNHDVRLQKV